ncbi:MAG: hypothetical protein ACXW5U_25445 [Thermoanaerobaculia bacterium]
MAETAGKWWQPLWKFAVHAFVATAIFALIAAPAVFLSFGVKWLETQEIDGTLVWGLRGAEYLLFFVDLMLFAWFVVRTAIRAGKDL